MTTTTQDLLELRARLGRPVSPYPAVRWLSCQGGISGAESVQLARLLWPLQSDNFYQSVRFWRNVWTNYHNTKGTQCQS